MAKIRIPKEFLSKLGPEMKMGVHWIDVKLKCSRILRNLEVLSGLFITGRQSDPNGVGELDFHTEDIADIKRQSLLTILIPFWPFW